MEQSRITNLHTLVLNDIRISAFFFLLESAKFKSEPFFLGTIKRERCNIKRKYKSMLSIPFWCPFQFVYWNKIIRYLLILVYHFRFYSYYIHILIYTHTKTHLTLIQSYLLIINEIIRINSKQHSFSFFLLTKKEGEGGGGEIGITNRKWPKWIGLIYVIVLIYVFLIWFME